ncbi:MAG TPA: SAM-dependent methyltransferase [Acidimicrobiales bacterium]|nr:SAM-dependent methyltransferase [Acidimicrobiales bacterium]
MRANRPSLTARWVAARRVQLARTRPSTPAGDVDGERALYRDVSGAFVLSLARPAGITHRTAFIDGEVAGAIGRGIEQIVILGAGYDGRAMRFGGTPTRWFEVDFPTTQADKRRRLEALALAPDHVRYIPLDLMVGDLDAALEAAGHDAAAPSLFLCEGLLAYLTLEASVTLLRTLRARSPDGSVLVATFLAAPEPRDLLLAWRRARDVMFRAIGEPRRNEFQPGDPEKLLVVTGWRVERSRSGRASRIDRDAQMVVLAGEPGDAVR